MVPSAPPRVPGREPGLNDQRLGRRQGAEEGADLVNPLHAAASVVGAIVEGMLSAWRIHSRDSAVIDPAFSRTTWIVKSGRWLRMMCHMANTATMGEEAVLTTPALPRVGPPYVSP